MLLTDRRQQQALRDFIEDHRTLSVDPKLLNDKYSKIYREIKNCKQAGYDWYETFQELQRIKMMDDHLKDAIDGVLARQADKPNEYLTLADVGATLSPTSWLWKSWIPRGFLTMLVADSGVGKTYLALDLSRRVIHASSAPDGQPLNIRSGRVIYIEAENFLSGLYHRALAWGMDLSRMYVLKKPERDLLNLTRKTYQDQILDMCYDLHPDLIVVDSFSSSHQKSDGAIEDVRALLDFFVELPTEFDCSVVVTHLLRKPQTGQSHQRITQHDVRGSGYLVQISRTTIGGYLLTENKNGPRRVEVINTNLCKYPTPIDFHFEPAPLDEDEVIPVYGTAPLSIDEGSSTLTAECSKWLLGTLEANGSMRYGDLKALAEQAGYSESTMQRARKTLDWQIIDTIGSKAPGNEWALYTDQAAPDPVKELPENGNSNTCTHAACVTPPPDDFLDPVTHAHVLHVLNQNLDENGKNQPKGGNLNGKQALSGLDHQNTVWPAARNNGSGNGHHRTGIHYPGVGPLPAGPGDVRLFSSGRRSAGCQTSGSRASRHRQLKRDQGPLGATWSLHPQTRRGGRRR